MSAKQRYLELRETAGAEVADEVFSHVTPANRQLWLAAR